MGLDDFDSTFGLNPAYGVASLKNADNQNRRSRKKAEHQLKRKPDSVEFSGEQPLESSPVEEPPDTQKDPDEPTLSGAFIDITI
jgi:hypothetical protein